MFIGFLPFGELVARVKRYFFGRETCDVDRAPRLVMREPGPPNAVAASSAGDDEEGCGWTAAAAAAAVTAAWPAIFAPCEVDEKINKREDPGAFERFDALRTEALASLRRHAFGGGGYADGERKGGHERRRSDGQHGPEEAEEVLVGFFLQMAREPKATLEVVKGVRKHFPDAPLMVGFGLRSTEEDGIVLTLRMRCYKKSK